MLTEVQLRNGRHDVVSLIGPGGEKGNIIGANSPGSKVLPDQKLPVSKAIASK